MATSRNKKFGTLPETQEFNTQELSEECYTQTVSEPAWAKLLCKFDSKITVELRQNHACFGRDYPSDENMDSFVFDEVNFIPKYVERISKCHFTIERVPLAESGAPNFNPAILTCHGRNGMFVNDQKLTIGDKKILANNDQLKLTRSIRWFDFTYQQIPIDIHTFPKQCRETYHVGNQIGSGGCGVVRLVHNYKTNERYAMKVILKDTNPMVRQRNHNNAKILNEVNIMKSLKNPHVLGLIDFYETPERVIIIMEYMEGRDMLHRITKGTSNGRYLSESDSKFFFYQACLGMKYLHDSYVSHRDIKPDNILLSDDGPDAVLKISDFGLSKFISVDSMKTVCGTQLYVAPEILIQGGTYTNKVDIWSMGCLLFAMLSGTVPFSETYGPPDISTQIKEARYSFRNRAWDGVSRTAKELIRKILNKNPKLRPSIDELLAHPWLRDNEMIKRVQRLYRLDETVVNSSMDTEMELTLVNVTLNEEATTSSKSPPLQKTPNPPPAKKRRII